jgi:hypothetical protein
LDAERARVAMRTCANGGGKSAVIGEEGIPQKGVEEVGDGHLPRKKEGPDETGKDVES